MILAYYIPRHELSSNDISVAKMSRSSSVLDSTSALKALEMSSLTSISAAKVSGGLPMPSSIGALYTATSYGSGSISVAVNVA